MRAALRSIAPLRDAVVTCTGIRGLRIPVLEIVQGEIMERGTFVRTATILPAAAVRADLI